MIENVFSSFDFSAFEQNGILDNAAGLGVFGSVISVITGIIYMMYGWQIFRVMVAILFAFFGFYLGTLIGDFFGWAVFGGVVLAILLAVLSLPLMRFATGVVIALLSAVIAGYLWHISPLADKYTIACAAAGLILGGLGGFYIFRLAVMIYTSLLGSAVVLTGLCGFLPILTVQDAGGGQTTGEVFAFPEQFSVPIILAILTTAGTLIQMNIHGISAAKHTENDK